MKKIFLRAKLLFVLAFPYCLQAQLTNDSSVVKQNQQKHTAALPKSIFRARANVTGLIDFFDTNISLGAEYQWNERNAVIVDIAYIFYTIYARSTTATNVGGFYIRPTYRRYWGKTNTSFVEGTFMYKNVSSTDDTWVGVNPVQGIPAYEIRKNVRSARNVYSLSWQIGGILNLNKQNTFRLEGWVGMGLRYRSYQPQLAANEIVRPIGGRAPLVDYGNSMRVTMPSGVRLTFSF